MQKLLIFNADYRRFAVEPIQHLFLTEPGFRNMRYHEPGGAVIEVEFVDGEDWTTIRLNRNLEMLSLSGTGVAALHAVLLLKQNLQGPLRITDMDYAFDLALSDFDDVEQLRNAIDDAQAG